MAQRKKQILRRKAAQAYQHIMRATEIILDLKEYFGEYHTDWGEMFLITANSLILILRTLRRLYELAWGYFPDDLDKWLR